MPPSPPVWLLRGMVSFCLLATCFSFAEDKDKPTSTKTPPAPSRYVKLKEHDPNGIGKFYMGREIAHVMGAAGIPWLERPEREDEEAPTKLVEALQLKPGDVVADIGAGSGRLSFLMAKKVAPSGTVYAVDLQPEMLQFIERKRDQLKLTWLKTVKSTTKSTRLQPGILDLAIMVDVYHEFAFPYEMMLDISKAMKPGGRVVLVEYRRENPEIPIKLVHKMSEVQVKKELGLPELELKWKETIGVLPRQHILVFEKQGK
ncbi:MAG: methyltransferase domain-containing protein [Planctomycetales bacterium]